MGLIQLNIFEFGGDLTWKGNILDLIRLENLLMVLLKIFMMKKIKGGLCASLWCGAYGISSRFKKSI